MEDGICNPFSISISSLTSSPRRFPINLDGDEQEETQVKKLAHHRAMESSLNRERAVAMPMLAPLPGELTGLQMPSENR